MPRSFSIKLYSETQVSDRLGMSGGSSPRHSQKLLSGERRKKVPITHHALSPPPLNQHLYIIHLINGLQRFYCFTMSLKRLFVPKSDVKQWFTTTTILESMSANIKSITENINFKIVMFRGRVNILLNYIIRVQWHLFLMDSRSTTWPVIQLITNRIPYFRPR